MSTIPFSTSLFAAQGFLPGDCLVTGLCGLSTAPPGPASGLMFLAVGLVLGGGWGWYRRRR